MGPMIRTFSLGTYDLVCIMTQAVNEATEPSASNEAYEAEDSKSFWMPQEVSSIHHSILEKPRLKRLQWNDSGIVLGHVRPRFKYPV